MVIFSLVVCLDMNVKNGDDVFLATGYHAKFIREKMTRRRKNYTFHGS
jgi:hypothetical protein